MTIVNGLGAPLDILSQGADIYGRVQDARRGPAQQVVARGESAPAQGKSPLAWIILGLAGVGLVVGGGMFLRSRSGRVRTNPPRRARKSRRARRAR
ncbi:MAG: hypothetical protein RL030_1807 [Pseudomonadota bacterium]|jgi:hypothetical protein